MTRIRSSKGQPSIQRRPSGKVGVLILFIPGCLCADGKPQRFPLGLQDNPQNRAIADRILRQVVLDIEYERFVWDKSLYMDGPKIPVRIKPIAEMSYFEVWTAYDAKTRDGLKPSTIALRNDVSNFLKSAPSDPDRLVDHLKNKTTEYRLRQVVSYLGSAFRWAIKRKLVKENPLEIIDLPPQQSSSEANPFSRSEKVKALELAADTKWIDFMRFCLLTGCRPSEAVGLTWGQISIESIRFDRSITVIRSKLISVDGSKNNRIRLFPLYPELENLINSLPRGGGLVFGDDRPIFYPAFATWWKNYINPWKNSTPYTTRDTFISEQILAGVPVAVVAKWCDNSIKMIEAKYLKVIPSEFIPK